ncbi:ATP-dependent RNA helicase HrpA [Leucothrix pacifica]|uniref:RNA helicase n=2 Tax=Leucothrix pacifica TaxID=1247513 RepID=A0A317CTS0_9GAMM|nr:ATP-dependent RNA helicase HrpA [Leucothrix pacifica]
MPKKKLQELKQQLNDCQAAQRFKLSRRLQRLHKKPDDNAINKLQDAITASCLRREHRKNNLPQPKYPEDLPVSERRDDILKCIQENQVTILCGETGSGKTTQIPKMCLELGRGVDGLIAHTQPRRIAARSVANRIAEELDSKLGDLVGYKVRFNEEGSEDNYIRLLTDGILLAEIRSDRFLNQYDTIIIDEAHERSLNIDFLLGYFKWLLPRRKDLKLIVTSATIDPERFSKHFDNAPIIEVSGRTYPVEVRYRPLVSENEDEADRNQIQGIIDASDELMREAPGDILVFLSGEREIRETAEALRKHHPASLEILPLFARLSAAEQNKIFNPKGRPRIVLATNVAETSLTVPGIRYVIDTGVARISRYSWRARVQRLPIEAISQASANQRSGRCGRTSDGIAIRLFSEEDFESRSEFTDPEILRTNLASVILQMAILRLGDVSSFPFVEAPDRRMIKDGFRLLFELGAVTESNNITEVGRKLAHLPTDPRLGRMLLAAQKFSALEEVLIIVSALASQDPRERPMDKQQASDEKHARFKDEKSDFIAYLNLWKYFQEKRKELTQNKHRQLCKKEFLSYLRLREWEDIYRQLRESLRDQGIKITGNEATPESIHQSLLSGLLSHVALQEDRQEYLGANGRKLFIFPASGLRKKSPKWIMAAEQVETSRLFARTVAAIQPEWIEQQAQHLIRRTYSEPRWEKRPAQVGADERTTLYGITIVAQRRINFGPIDPVVAREIFIRHALVYGEFNSKAEFLVRNRELIQEVEKLEAKSRRRDILVDEDILYDYYDQRVPKHIYNGKAFEKWRKKLFQENPKALIMTREDLMQRDDSHVKVEQYPDSLEVHGMRLPLSYLFEPGNEKDGVTLSIPAAALHQINSQRFDYLVPGMLDEKVTELIRSLPKQTRKQFVPVPDYAAACCEAIEASDEVSLLAAVAHQLHRMSGTQIDQEALKSVEFSDHNRMRFAVVDEAGKVIKAGRDLEKLKGGVERTTSEQLQKRATKTIERENITQWDFGDLPEDTLIKTAGMQIKAWPALVDNKDSVSVQLFDNQAKAQRQQGLRRLYMLALRKEATYLQKNLPNIQKLCLNYASTGSCDELKKSIVANSFRLTFDCSGIRAEKDFKAELEQHKTELIPTGNQICEQLAICLPLVHKIRKGLKGGINPLALEALADIKVQLESLVYPGFLDSLSMETLRQYPRYLKATERRLEKLQHSLQKDRGLRLQVSKHTEQYMKLIKAKPELASNEELLKYRWMIEEFRVSLFAQELGTAMPVSDKRLNKQWQLINSI